MRFVIVGVGALGGWIGAHLLADGAECVLVDRPEEVAARRARPLRWRSADGALHDLGPVELAAAEQVQGYGDALLLCVPDTALEEACTASRRLCHVETAILPLTRGSAVTARTIRAMARPDVCAAVAELDCRRDPDDVLHAAGPGLIRVAERGRSGSWRLAAVEASLNAAGVPCRIDPALGA
jgi:2-dehydropantoate 2-reductase